MKTFVAAMARGGGTVLMVLVILLLLLWFGGEGLGWQKQTRVIWSVVIIAAGLGVVLVQRFMAFKSALLIEQRLRAQAQEQIASARPDQQPEIKAVQGQLDEAIAALKQSRLGKSALYALPWYMIIGPPGSGKSTALGESGLNFPYVSQGRKGVRGVGGTRNCDWWFTDEGILLDTAGRYTTEIDDRQEWLGFLDLLKKARKHKPINGAMVAVAVSDLLSATDEELQAYAKTIRDRLDELTKQLEIVFPVYLLFTKCDLLQGFTDFFEDFSRNDRAQVWGCTWPYRNRLDKPYREAFDEECRKLFRSLSTQRLGSLASERPSAKKQSVYLFPLQFQAASKKLGDFVEALFRPNPFQESAVFRGFYFTSGTQEGTPIDQVIRSLSAAFGLKEEAAPPPAPADKKSYFINHLFTRIIFPDQNLARTSARVAKRQKLAWIGTLAGSAVATVFFLFAFAFSFFGNRALVKEAGAAAEKAKAAPSLESLEALRREAEQLDRHDRQSPPLGLRYGLYRGSTVNPHVRKVYFDALRRLLLVPAAERVGRELDELDKKEGKNAQDFDSLNDLHRVYQMLGGAPGADRNRDLVEQTLAAQKRWYAGAGGEATPAAEAQLRFFVTQLDRPEEWKVTIDGALERRVKEHLAQGLWVLQSFRDVVDTTKGGFAAVTGERFVRGPGKALLQFGYTFSGLFTQQGWNDVGRSAVRSKAEALARRFKEIGVDRKQEDVESELREKYAEQYAREWEAFTKGVKIPPFPFLEDASTRIKILAGDESPLTELFRGLWEQQLLRLSDADLKPALELKPVDDARNVLYEFHLAIEEFAGAAQRGSRIVSGIKDGKLAKLLESFKTASRGLDAAIRRSEPRLQQPGLRAVLMQAIDGARQALAAEAQSEADSLWAREVAKPWKEQLSGRYPFDAKAADGAPITAVTKLFNRPTGTFWAAVADLNAAHAINFEGKPLVVYSRDYLGAVKKAETLRDALYPASGDKLAVAFACALKQRAGVTHVRLKVGNKEFTHNESPDGRGTFSWKEAEPGAKFSVRVGDLNRWSEKEFADDWGLLRLIAAGGPQPQGATKLACSYTFKETVQGVELEFTGEAVFEAEGAQNPFQKDLFSGWAVPDRVGP